jgi:molybdate transport system ATP-binding protein
MVFAPEAVMNLLLRGLRLPLAHFTLEIEETLSGRVTALFGPSGSGKTSLLEIIAGLRRPAAGIVSLDGSVLTDIAARIHRRPQQRAIGYVPQEGALFPHLSVRENLLYGCAQPDAANSVMSFRHVVEVLEIEPLIDRRVLSLSGGEKQRVALGRALLSSPKMLLLDEPLSGLDTALKERLLTYLQRVRDEFGVPMVYVTHSAEEVMALSDDVVVIERGRVKSHGRPEQLFLPTPVPQFRLRQ